MKFFNKPGVRHLVGTVVSVVLSVALSRYLPPAGAAEIGRAAGQAVVGGA